MATAIRNLPTGGSILGTKNITLNGNYTASADGLDGYSSISVNVPNSYTSEDEGKVINSGVLVAQTAREVTENGTYDTTSNNSVLVNIESGSSLPSELHISTSAPTAVDGSDGDTWWTYGDAAIEIASGANDAYFALDYEYFAGDSMEIRFYISGYYNDYEYIVAAVYGSSGNNGYIGIRFADGLNGALQILWSVSRSSSVQLYTSSLTKSSFLNAAHTIKLSVNEVYIDGILVHTFSGTPDNSAPISTLKMFDLYYGAGYPGLHTHINYLKVWDSSGTLVRNYQPYNDSGTAKLRDNTAGTFGPSTASYLTYVPAHKHVELEYVKQDGTWVQL